VPRPPSSRTPVSSPPLFLTVLAVRSAPVQWSPFPSREPALVWLALPS